MEINLYSFLLIIANRMSRRRKILIVIVILILVILALLYWFVLAPKYFNVPGGGTNTNATAPLPPLALAPVNIPSAAPPVQVSDAEKLKSDLTRLAAAFAERLGSYSNQSNFENLSDLKVLMTSKMQNWTDDFIAQSKASQGNNAVYFGVTTKAVSSNIITIDEGAGEATVLVSTQRREASGTMSDNVKIYYQDLELKFKKISGEWKVDEATWK